jgi:cysteinyl-tRNA synthetase
MKFSLFSSLLLVTMLFYSCPNSEITAPVPDGIDARQEMRDFVIGLSDYAKTIRSDFSILPQNGIELVTLDGEANGTPATAYLNAIDGHGQEDLFYGYNNDDVKTPEGENTYLRELLDVSLGAGNTIFVTDYCSTPGNMDDAIARNTQSQYISFPADHRELDNIPTYPGTLTGENNDQINSLAEAKNFLYLINPGNFTSKEAYIAAVTATNYDLLIMDLFFGDGEVFSSEEIAQLKQKANGGSRQVICYMSIGEAEDYRYYWQGDWTGNRPSWLDNENPAWAGNFKVRYWEAEWQDIIF